jgi:hypothetical protein
MIMKKKLGTPQKIILTRGIENEVQVICARMKAYQLVCEFDGGVVVAGLVALAAAAEDAHPLEPARLLPHHRQPRLLFPLYLCLSAGVFWFGEERLAVPLNAPPMPYIKVGRRREREYAVGAFGGIGIGVSFVKCHSLLDPQVDKS